MPAKRPHRAPDPDRGTGIRIRAARRALGLTQAQLAALVPCATRQVSMWESGRYAPSGDLVPGLCIALKQSADYVFGLRPARGPRLPRQRSGETPKPMTPEELRDLYAERLRLATAVTRHTSGSLSYAIGSSYTTVHGQRKGVYLPRADVLRNLCRELGVSADYLLGMDV